MKKILILLAIPLLFNASCKKENTFKTELEKLPPITQTGANTFACLLNGKAWIPKDNYGQATFKLDVDPTLGNGIFVLSAKRYEDNSIFTSFAIGSVGCTTGGIYNLTNASQVFNYLNTELSCSYGNTTMGTFKDGAINITKYDLVNRVFSGTFDFTIYLKGCGDTLHFTNGRFDKKL